MASRRYTTDEEREYYKAHIVGNTYENFAKEFEQVFGWLPTKYQIEQMRKRTGVTTGRSQRYPKGHKSWNKGKKMSPDHYEHCKPYFLQKGHNVTRKSPIGSERKSCRGFVEVKVKQPNVWMSKAKYIYEQHHGKIPDGYYVRHIDGDFDNYDIDNLILIHESASIKIKTHQLKSAGKEYAETYVLNVTLDSLINKKEKTLRGDKT